nr:hypothetical transcript [Hymenolepis microstoma]
MRHSSFAFFFIFIVCAQLSSSEDNFIVREVTIRPGGVARSESIKAFGIICKFDYTCQGGTDRIACHIQRPTQSSSYLFFQKFALSVSGPAKIVAGAAYADHTKLMPKEEYILDLSKNELHASVEFELRDFEYHCDAFICKPCFFISHGISKIAITVEFDVVTVFLSIFYN